MGFKDRTPSPTGKIYSSFRECPFAHFFDFVVDEQKERVYFILGELKRFRRILPNFVRYINSEIARARYSPDGESDEQFKTHFEIALCERSPFDRVVYTLVLQPQTRLDILLREAEEIRRKLPRLVKDFYQKSRR
jgi:hypothetical protein